MVTRTVGPPGMHVASSDRRARGGSRCPCGGSGLVKPSDESDPVKVVGSIRIKAGKCLTFNQSQRNKITFT